MNTHRLLIRLALVVLWIALGLVVFVQYRGHTLLVDNRNGENPALQAPDMIDVSIDGGKSLEFFRGDRVRFTITGSNHRINIEFSNGSPPVEMLFSVGLKNDMYLLSVPKMLSGIEPFVEVFYQTPEPRTTTDELPVTDDGTGEFL
jgi:hypothetical protein